MYGWTASENNALVPGDFSFLLEHADGVDWVLLGTGRTMQVPPPAVARAFEERRLGFEYMSTASAVRTYNVVLAEGRRVAAALIAVEQGHA